VSHLREQIALSPPAVAHSLNEAIQQRKPRNLFYFWMPHPPTRYYCVRGFSGALVSGASAFSFAPVIVRVECVCCVCAGGSTVHRSSR
jgi:hypothetical protein